MQDSHPRCPTRPSNTEQALLVAFLADWTDGDVQKTVHELQRSNLLKNVQITTWRPSESDSPPGQGQYVDSQANIHALAIGASRSGWSGLVVADGLTKRQLNLDARNGESSVTSYVLVAVRAGKESDRVEVIARRTARDEKDAVSLDVLASLDTSLPGRLWKLTPEDGLKLHDPHRALFAMDSVSSGETAGGHNSGSVWPYDGAEEPSFPESVPKVGRSLNVFALFQTEPEGLEETQSVIQRAVLRAREHGDSDEESNEDAAIKYNKKKPLSVHLVPCHHDRSPSRQDVFRMWEAYTGHMQDRTDAMHFLLQPLEDARTESESETSSSQPQPFITVYRNRTGRPLVAARNTLKTVIKDALNYPYSSVRLYNLDKTAGDQGIQEFSNDYELLIPNHLPFYPTPKPWKPVSKYLNSVAFFYLTGSFSRDQQRELEAEIQIETDVDVADDPKICCFVPWEKGPEDGTVPESVWEIFWDMRSYKRSDDYIGPPYIFVDRRSAVDGTVIVVYPDYYFGMRGDENAQEILKDVVDPSIRGLVYGRIKGRDSHSVHANLSISNMDFEEFFEDSEFEIQKARRIGWPGHGILKNDGSEDENENEE
ncbi:hypothetical protein BDW62DRAFT_48629 [Aspergillus aurantiobrunneus]